VRLTTSDASFLYTETASGPMHISSIIILDGELDFQSVYGHIEDRLPLLPAYRRKLVQVPMNIAHPTWVDDADFDLANHVIDYELDEGLSLDEAIAEAVKINEPLLGRDLPLWRAHVLRGVAGKTVLLHQTHHCMIDGASGVELMSIIYDFDPEGDPIPEAQDNWQPDKAPDPMTIFNEALSENMTTLANTDWSSQMAPPSPERQQMMQKAAKVMSDFVTKPVITAPFNAGQVGPRRELGWMKRSFDEIREVRRAFGGTINDVVLTVVSEAVSEYLISQNEETAEQYMRVMCPVNVRTENQKGALGNQVSAIFPVLPAWTMPTEQRLALVTTETGRIKANQDAQALTFMQESAVELWPVASWATQLIGTPFDPTRIAAMAPLPVLPSMGRRPPHIGYNFTCTNVPGPQVPQYLCGKEVTDQIGLLILNGNIGFSVTILSYNKTLFFGFICEPRLLPNIQSVALSAENAFDVLLSQAREQMKEIQAEQST
jgi:diacylglycerol O-acyltransferase